MPSALECLSDIILALHSLYTGHIPSSLNQIRYMEKTITHLSAPPTHTPRPLKSPTPFHKNQTPLAHYSPPLFPLRFVTQHLKQKNRPFRFHTDPTGTYFSYDAKAIGSASEGAQSALQDSYHKVRYQSTGDLWEGTRVDG